MCDSNDDKYSAIVVANMVTFMGNPVFPGSDFDSFKYAGILSVRLKSSVLDEGYDRDISTLVDKVYVAPAKTYRKLPQQRLFSSDRECDDTREYKMLYEELAKTIQDYQQDPDLHSKSSVKIPWYPLGPCRSTDINSWVLKTMLIEDEIVRETRLNRLKSFLRNLHDPENVKDYSVELIKALESLPLTGTLENPKPPTKQALRRAFRKLIANGKGSSEANDSFKDAINNCGFMWLP